MIKIISKKKYAEMKATLRINDEFIIEQNVKIMRMNIEIIAAREKLKAAEAELQILEKKLYRPRNEKGVFIKASN